MVLLSTAAVCQIYDCEDTCVSTSLSLNPHGVSALKLSMLSGLPSSTAVIRHLRQRAGRPVRTRVAEIDATPLLHAESVPSEKVETAPAADRLPSLTDVCRYLRQRAGRPVRTRVAEINATPLLYESENLSSDELESLPSEDVKAELTEYKLAIKESLKKKTIKEYQEVIKSFAKLMKRLLKGSDALEVLFLQSEDLEQFEEELLKQKKKKNYSERALVVDT